VHLTKYFIAALVPDKTMAMYKSNKNRNIATFQAQTDTLQISDFKLSVILRRIVTIINYHYKLLAIFQYVFLAFVAGSQVCSSL